jgi:NADPH2 dehydrogenase
MKIGAVEVQHRFGMPPMSRLRSTANHLPTALEKEYYSQRSIIPGTLVFTGGAAISPASGSLPHGPGIYNDEQIAAWKEITQTVHEKGSFIFIQLVAFGRYADPATIEGEGHSYIAPSAIPIPKEGSRVPRAMTLDEIKQTVQDFGKAAKNAMEAGFDGVELGGANGLLLDQFIQDVSNHRDDEYGGSIENRSRFSVEVAKVVADAIGPERVGYRISPWSIFSGMRMGDPIPQYTDLISKLNEVGLAYLHMIESRIAGDVLIQMSETLDFAYDTWKRTFLVAGGYTPETARKLVDEEHPDKEIWVGFGRSFIANPDLVYRVKHGLQFNQYDRPTFYAMEEPKGYVDYPFSEGYLASN